jgi:hypothetical protein
MNNIVVTSLIAIDASRVVLKSLWHGNVAS